MAGLTRSVTPGKSRSSARTPQDAVGKSAHTVEHKQADNTPSKVGFDSQVTDDLLGDVDLPAITSRPSPAYTSQFVQPGSPAYEADQKRREQERLDTEKKSKGVFAQSLSSLCSTLFGKSKRSTTETSPKSENAQLSSREQELLYKHAARAEYANGKQEALASVALAKHAENESNKELDYGELTKKEFETRMSNFGFFGSIIGLVFFWPALPIVFTLSCLSHARLQFRNGRIVKGLFYLSPFIGLIGIVVYGFAVASP